MEGRQYCEQTKFSITGNIMYELAAMTSSRGPFRYYVHAEINATIVPVVEAIGKVDNPLLWGNLHGSLPRWFPT